MSAKKANASKKAKKSSKKPLPDSLFAAAWRKWERVPTSAAMVVLVVALFGAFWYVVWQGAGDWPGVRERVVSEPTYQLTPQGIHIPPLPPWIDTSDVRTQALRSASLDMPALILERDLAERVGQAFALHPWVDEVRRVRKRHPAEVEVDLTYRRPVCMVAVPDGVLPVDARGVLLPTDDFTSLEAARYPRLLGIESGHVGVGSFWGDERVLGAAGVAGFLGEHWEALDLAHIVPCQQQGPRSGPFAFELYTHRNTRIVWGVSPTSAPNGEPTAQDKLARLFEYHRIRGTLEGPDGPQQIDLRNPDGLRAYPLVRISRKSG